MIFLLSVIPAPFTVSGSLPSESKDWGSVEGQVLLFAVFVFIPVAASHSTYIVSLVIFYTAFPLYLLRTTLNVKWDYTQQAEAL